MMKNMILILQKPFDVPLNIKIIKNTSSGVSILLFNGHNLPEGSQLGCPCCRIIIIPVGV